ncbi:uncharacterized protein LOC133793688 [Humulus lupulus]|uniref:uncharacterized protein LOC133793688 n=1 Tax=Humulus lupulus TaxID=3486 RepID=UPI002B4175AB|nr:uncharacterized protein LOC133793688 [Humulus lupulus]
MEILRKSSTSCTIGFSRMTRACLSTAYERAQKLGGRGEGESTTDHTKNDVVSGSNIERKSGDHKIEDESGIRGFVADKAREGAIGARKVAENMGDLAKETMDTAWDSANNTTQNVQDTLIATADKNVVDTTEYRSIEDLNNSVQPNQDHHHPTP